MKTKARLLAVACLLQAGALRAQTRGAGGGGAGGPVAPAVAAGWAGQINAYFGSASAEPAALAGVLSSLKGLDLGAPEVRSSLSPVIAQIQVSAASSLADIRKREEAWKIWESNFPGAPLNQEHVLDAALKLRMLRALDPVLVRTQAASFEGKPGALDERIIRAIDARLDAESLAKLDAKMNEMAAALNRSLEPEPASVDASMPSPSKELPDEWKLRPGPERELALARALRKGDSKTVERLLDGGENIEAVSLASGRSLLQRAMEFGYPEMVRLLVKKGARTDRALVEWADKTGLADMARLIEELVPALAGGKLPEDKSIDELPAMPADILSWKLPETRSRPYEKARRSILQWSLRNDIDVDHYASAIDERLRRLPTADAVNVMMELMQRELRPREASSLSEHDKSGNSRANAVLVITRLFVERGWGRYVWERELFQTLVRTLAAKKGARINRENWMKYALGGGAGEVNPKWLAHLTPLDAVAKAVVRNPDIPEASTVELAPYLLRGLAASIDWRPGEIEHVADAWRLPLMRTEGSMAEISLNLLSALETLARNRPELLAPGQRAEFFASLAAIGADPKLPSDLRERAREIERTLPREAPPGAPARETASPSVALTVRPGTAAVPARDRGAGTLKKIGSGSAASAVVVAAGLLGGLPAGLIVGGALLVGARARAARRRARLAEQALLADPDYAEAVRELDALIETWNDPAAPLVPKT